LFHDIQNIPTFDANLVCASGNLHQYLRRRLRKRLISAAKGAKMIFLVGGVWSTRWIKNHCISI